MTTRRSNGFNPGEAHTEAVTLRTLDTIERGHAVTVVALSERPVAVLRELAAAGVAPDTPADVVVSRLLSTAARQAVFVSTNGR